MRTPGKIGCKSNWASSLNKVFIIIIIIIIIEHHILIHSVHKETQRAFKVSIKFMSAGNTDVLPYSGRIKCRILVLVTYAVDPILIRMCN